MQYTPMFIARFLRLIEATVWHILCKFVQNQQYWYPLARFLMIFDTYLRFLCNLNFASFKNLLINFALNVVRVTMSCKIVIKTILVTFKCYQFMSLMIECILLQAILWNSVFIWQHYWASITYIVSSKITSNLSKSY